MLPHPPKYHTLGRRSRGQTLIQRARIKGRTIYIYIYIYFFFFMSNLNDVSSEIIGGYTGWWDSHRQKLCLDPQR